jgi:hypothetical protein
MKANPVRRTKLTHHCHLVCSCARAAPIRAGWRNRPPGKPPRGERLLIAGATHALQQNRNLVAPDRWYDSQNQVAMQENPAHSTILTIP